MTQSNNQNDDNEKVKGTVSKYNNNTNNKYKDFAVNVASSKNIYIVIVVVLLLNYLGFISLPFVSTVEDLPYYNAIMTVLVSSVITIITLRSRINKIIEDIYTKNWSYIAYIDATGQYLGVWKTDPETLNRVNDKIDFKKGETVEHYREGIDEAGRRYGLVKDLKQVDDDSQVKYRLQNIMGWDEVPADDQIISEKTQLKQWMEQVLPEAEQGRKERLSRGALKQKIISDVVTKIAVKYENATQRGVLDMDDLYSDVFDQYETINNDVDDFIKETQITEIKEDNKETKELNEGDNNE